MKPQDKARGDAKLKNLPEARQELLMEQIRECKSLRSLAAELAKDGLATSARALSEFRSWYLLQEQLRHNESTVSQVLEQLKAENPSMSEDQLFSAGQTFFSALAIQQQDSLTWKRTQDAKTKRDLMELSRVKFQRETCELFLKWRADKRATEIADSKGLSHQEKLDQLYLAMFGEERTPQK